MLAAGMLALGVGVGAAIGPAPSTSFAGEGIPLLADLRSAPSIAALAVTGAGGHGSASTVQSPVTAQATPAAAPATAGTDGFGPAHPDATTRPPESKTPSGTVVPPTSTPTPNTSKTPTTTGKRTTGKRGKQTTPPPITSVWLITISGGTFAQALAQPAAAPFVDSQLVPAGTLLGGWSALAGSSFASEAAQLGDTPPQTLNSIVQPPCPEGAAGAQCAPETAGALTAADEFLKATIPAILASAAYRAHGLIVVTFGAVDNATASGLPAGASTATLSTEPPVGVLLLSPFVHAGARRATAFNPTSPKQSLSGLLH